VACCRRQRLYGHCRDSLTPHTEFVYKSTGWCVAWYRLVWLIDLDTNVPEVLAVSMLRIGESVFCIVGNDLPHHAQKTINCYCLENLRFWWHKSKGEICTSLMGEPEAGMFVVRGRVTLCCRYLATLLLLQVM
jgi:hypothetical protein